jgi:hypothetical protein
MLNFISKKGTELQTKIVTEAKSELLKVENIRKVREKEERDRKIMKEKEAKDKAEGKIPVDEDGSSTGWARASVAQPVVSSGPKREENDGFLGRSAMGSSKPEEKKSEDAPKGRPTFSKQTKKEDGGAPMTRAGFGGGNLLATTSSQSANTPKAEELKKDNSSTSDNQWRTTTAPSKPAPTTSGNSSGFARGSNMAKAQSEKQPESSGGPWRSSGPQNNRGGKK